MSACLIVSTYPPRKCGIATFARDLRDNLIKHPPQVLVAAMEDPYQSHNYPGEVILTIQQENIGDYTACAAWANREPDLDIVIIQHEYGIFGGPNGEYILKLVQHLRKPYLLVTHTVLPHPSANQHRVLSTMASSAAGVICMTRRARKLLSAVYGVSRERTVVVPHGVPVFVKKNRNTIKERHLLSHRTIITTFGLIGPGKGLEIGIKALSRLVEEHPQVLYLIAGATHPVLLRSEGERYRESIEQLVRDLKLEEHVWFDNRFLTDEELGEYLYMTDIYLSPYPNMDQAVSGTLAFAVGSGRAIVSTPYEYAQEVLSGGRGLLAREASAQGLAELMDLILRNPALKQELEASASALGRSLTWPSVAALYHKITSEILEDRVDLSCRP